MPLLDPGTALPVEAIRRIRGELVEELREMRELLEVAPGTPEERRARSRTALDLVDDGVRWARDGSGGADRAAMVAEVNLLYDLVLVAAEYYKLFARDPTPERPAGRI